MNQDELKGKYEKAKGQAKQVIGNATGNDRLHDEGVADETTGQVREGVGKVRRKIGEAVEDIGERIKK